ncbi:MAG: alkaline phosphatase PhoX [Pseudomonadota bacterium]
MLFDRRILTTKTLREDLQSVIWLVLAFQRLFCRFCADAAVWTWQGTAPGALQSGAFVQRDGPLNRRNFLTQSSGIAVALASGVAGSVDSLRPSSDQASGLDLIELPGGFRYRTFGWRGDPLEQGMSTPGRHDGMAVVSAQDNQLTLVRNHEMVGDSGAFGPAEMTYDPAAIGGTTTLTVDARSGELLNARASLAGTLTNCAGGATPWGTWLSCEEDCVDPGLIVQGRTIRLEKKHGFVFEVPATGGADPQPIKAMGQFAHEAVAVDPATSICYQTEDRYVAAGLYRYLPDEAKNLHAGGRLQMLRVTGRDQMITDVPRGALDVSWVDIENPERGHVNPLHQDRSGVVSQGLAAGGTAFSRLEGCWFDDGKVFFSSTNGGNLSLGQIFVLDVKQQTLALLYESSDAATMDKPDNLTVAPNGAVVICEDGTRKGQLLLGLTRAGKLKPIARNVVNLKGERNGFEGDYSDAEWCGACFSPDGQWLFANIQKPGLTVAITGPFEDYLS